MKKDKIKPGQTDPRTGNRIPHAEKALRKRAEEIIMGKTVQSAENFDTLTPEEIRQTLYELRVHQIELEMQNEELRKAQTELDDSRARYFDLYDLAPVGYITVNEKGLILEANLTAVTMLGATRSTLIRQFITRFIDKESQDIYYHHRNQIFKTANPQVCELQMLHADGTLFWTRLEAAISQNSDGLPVCNVIMSDISEHKKGEKALKESEALYRLLADHITDMVWLMDMNLITTYISPSVKKQRGYTLEEMLQKPLDRNLTPSSAQLAMEVFSKELPKAMSNPTYSFSKTIDLEFINKNGTASWLECLFSIIRDDKQNPVSILGVGRDITEHKLLEKKLKESEKRLELFFAQSLDGFFFMMLDEPIVWDDSIDKEKALEYVFTHMRLTKVNEAMLKQYGATEEQLIGFTPKDFFVHNLKQGRQILKDIFDHGKLHSESMEKKFDGTEMIIEGDYICFYDSDRRITGHFGIQRDMTAARQADENLRKSKNELEEYFENDISANFVSSMEGEIFGCNKTFLGMFGFKNKSEAKKTNFLQLYRNSVERDKLIGKIIEKGKVENYEVDFVSGEGEIIYAILNAIGISNNAGEVSKIRGYIVDITAQKVAENELRETKQVTEDIINAIHARVFWKDRNLMYLGCNAEFARDAGFSDPKDIIGKDDFQMGWHDQAELYRSDDLQVIESGCPKLNIEEPQTTPDGNTITLFTSKIPLLDLNGKIIGVIGTYIDISRRKQAEEKNLRQLEELQRWQEVILRREDRNRQLKQEVNELLIRLGETIRYPSQSNNLI